MSVTYNEENKYYQSSSDEQYTLVYNDTEESEYSGQVIKAELTTAITRSKHNIEVFETEQEMIDRIIELNLITDEIREALEE